MLTITGVELRDDVLLIKKYSYFVLSKFVQNSVLKKSNIRIQFVNGRDLKPKDRKELKEFSAWMFYDGIVNGRKQFTITMDLAIFNKRAKTQIKKLRESLKNLGHELVHVKQYLNNELFDYRDGVRTRYKNTHYINDNSNDWSYWDMPWEVEAYGRMEGLYQMFLKMLKDEKKA